MLLLQLIGARNACPAAMLLHVLLALARAPRQRPGRRRIERARRKGSRHRPVLLLGLLMRRRPGEPPLWIMMSLTTKHDFLSVMASVMNIHWRENKKKQVTVRVFLWLIQDCRKSSAGVTMSLPDRGFTRDTHTAAFRKSLGKAVDLEL